MAWLWFCLFLISLGANIALLLRPDKAFEWAALVDYALHKIGQLLRRKSNCWLLIVTVAGGLACLPGCEQATPVQVVALPAPDPEQPPANLPPELHQRNWVGPLGQGSCVHASLVNHLRWLNDWQLAERWKRTYSDGEYESRLRRRLDAAGIDYGYTLRADPRFLDWASATRRGAIIWWKPAHCCTFVGWVQKNGKQYAAILDNNYPGRFELTEREQFLRLWAGYGGFGLAVFDPPASSKTWKSYEVIK